MAGKSSLWHAACSTQAACVEPTIEDTKYTKSLQKIAASAAKTMQSERAQKIAKQTGALVYWMNAADSAARIEVDKKTVSRIGEILK